MPYQVLEHTADIGLRVTAPTFEELLRDAAAGFFFLTTDIEKANFPHARKSQISFSLKAEDAGELFLKWLREWLFYFSSKRFVPLEIQFKSLDEKHLEAEASGILFDPKVHEQKYEIKAVTYHEFRFEKQGSGWLAEVILDI